MMKSYCNTRLKKLLALNIVMLALLFTVTAFAGESSAADNAEFYMSALQKQNTISSYYKVDSGEVLEVISELSK